MDYGILLPTYIDMWREVQAAEEAGFSHAWFPDSQLIWSDCYAAMALAADKTSRITLGTLVSIPSNRIAPVTATAVASINKLAPGRVVLSLGTGYTGRNTMGLPSYPVAAFREYAAQVRGLLDGEDVLFREGDRERWIRLIHGDHPDFMNLDDPIPIFLAANGPKAMAVVGEMGDGWVTSGASPRVAEGFDVIRAGAEAAGRHYEKPYTVVLEGACVLREGESLMSPRVLDRVGAIAAVRLHTMWEAKYGRWGIEPARRRRRPRRPLQPLHRRVRRRPRSPRRPALPGRARGPLHLPQGGRGGLPGGGADRPDDHGRRPADHREAGAAGVDWGGPRRAGDRQPGGRARPDRRLPP